MRCRNFFLDLHLQSTVAKYVSLLSTYTFENYSLLTYSCTDNEPADHHIGIYPISHRITSHVTCHQSPRQKSHQITLSVLPVRNTISFDESEMSRGASSIINDLLSR